MDCISSSVSLVASPILDANTAVTPISAVTPATTSIAGFAANTALNPACATVAPSVAAVCATVAAVCVAVAAACASCATVDAASAVVAAVRIPISSAAFFPKSTSETPASFTSEINFLLLFTTKIPPIAVPASSATGTIVSRLSATSLIPFCAIGRYFTSNGCTTSACTVLPRTFHWFVILSYLMSFTFSMVPWTFL